MKRQFWSWLDEVEAYLCLRHKERKIKKAVSIGRHMRCRCRRKK